MTTPLSVYFAGALFNHKELLGNAVLAAYIEQCSAGQYVCILPQNFEQTEARAVDIRNQDLRQVMTCDLGLFNFDGSDLDSGTVAEFMLAKFLDIPSVILRSDFRVSGDQGLAGDAWNLMCSFYPRTHIVQCHAMMWYQQARQEGGTLHDLMHRLYTRLAQMLVESLDAVRHEPPLANRAPDDMERLYQWASRFPGGGFAEHCAEHLVVEALVAEKRKKGLV